MYTVDLLKKQHYKLVSVVYFNFIQSLVHSIVEYTEFLVGEINSQNYLTRTSTTIRRKKGRFPTLLPKQSPLSLCLGKG